MPADRALELARDPLAPKEIADYFDAWLAHEETAEIEHPDTIAAVRAASSLLRSLAQAGPTIDAMDGSSQMVWVSAREFKELSRVRAQAATHLRRYGKHEDYCGYVFDQQTQAGEFIDDCTCGFDAALKGYDAERQGGAAHGAAPGG